MVIFIVTTFHRNVPGLFTTTCLNPANREEFMKNQPASEKQAESPEGSSDGSEPKRTFVEPKLTYVEPELVKQGKLAQVTGFFGTFSP